MPIANVLNNEALEYKFYEIGELFWFVHCCAQNCSWDIAAARLIYSEEISVHGEDYFQEIYVST